MTIIKWVEEKSDLLLSRLDSDASPFPSFALASSSNCGEKEREDSRVSHSARK